MFCLTELHAFTIAAPCTQIRQDIQNEEKYQASRYLVKLAQRRARQTQANCSRETVVTLFLY